jgi:hypothetical protein
LLLAVLHELLLTQGLLLLHHGHLLSLDLSLHLSLFHFALLLKKLLLLLRLELLALHLFLFLLSLAFLLILCAALLLGTLLLGARSIFLRGSLSFGLLASGLLSRGLIGTVVTLIFGFGITGVVSTNAENLLHVRRSIDARGSGGKHLLQPSVRLLGLLTGENHGRLDINLLLDH